MLGIKRLYWFMLRTFLPLFFMTFFICLFILLMQFIWTKIDELVGKGLDISVLAELFFYASLSTVPLALPLSILLSSLMTFGNLGERFELTAMKASGVSLIKTMSPLIVFIVFVSIGAFFFQNYVQPIAQTKMYTLLFSVRQKSPELEIPEGVFYDQIPGYNIYVESKDRNTGTLYDMMIYDVSRGFENSRIILADSGHLKLANDQAHLFLQLYNGEQFENLRENQGGASSANSPYRRESFALKEILMSFDAGFSRIDESGIRSQYVGQNITQLRASIDSMTVRIDSVSASYGQEIKEAPYMRVRYYSETTNNDQLVRTVNKPVTLTTPINIDSLFYKERPTMVNSYLSQALMKAQTQKRDYEFKSYSVDEDRKLIRRHGIELQKKFTLSFACLIFFFIGAPLGAIIRKGGLGTPLVISVLLFIFYYIIDNTGFKMARDGKIEVWQGMWLSSTVLLPMGIFLTYKAMRDSAVMDFDSYKNFFRRISGKLKRELDLKEFTMQEIDQAEAIARIDRLQQICTRLQKTYASMNLFKRLWHRLRPLPLQTQAQTDLNELIEYLSDTRDAKVIYTLNKYPFRISIHKIAAITEINSQLLNLFTQQTPTQSQPV